MTARKILYVQFTNPAAYPPLEHSSRILANEGWQVLFLGTKSQGAKDLDFPPHPGIKVFRLSFVSGGWLQKLHYAGFAVWTFYWAVKWRPKWIYASDMLSCPVAVIFTFFRKVHVLYHEHDSPAPSGAKGNLSIDVKATWFTRFALWTRTRLAGRADICVLPNEGRIKHFKLATGTARPVLCIFNCPRREEAILHSGPISDDLVLYYHGNIGPDLLPLTVLGALAELPSVRLRAIGYTTLRQESYLENFREHALMLGVSRRVEILPAMPRYELLAHARECSVGLALMPMHSEDINFQNMVGASNKAFDYLACGLPLLVAARDDWSTTFVRPGYGMACDPADSNSIARALQWFLEDPIRTRIMGQRGRDAIIREWHYERQFAPARELLERH